MVWVLFLFFFNTQPLRPADTDKIANLAHHSKSLGTAVLVHKTVFSMLAFAVFHIRTVKRAVG